MLCDYLLGVAPCLRLAGGCPAASYFSCAAKKSNQKKAAPLPPPSFGGFPALLEAPGGCGTRPCKGRRASNSPRRQLPAPLRCSAALKGAINPESWSAESYKIAVLTALYGARSALEREVLKACKSFLPNQHSALNTPLKPPTNTALPGAFGEDCLRPVGPSSAAARQGE